MDQAVSVVSGLLTKEVITVLTVLVTAWAGWKVAAKSAGMVAGWAQKCSFLGLVSAVMLVTGLGSATVGIGDLACRSAKFMSTTDNTPAIAMGDKELIELAKNNSKEVVEEVLSYARNRKSGELPANYNRDHLSPQALAAIVQTSGENNQEAVVQLLKYLEATHPKGTPQIVEISESKSTKNEQFVSLPGPIELPTTTVSSYLPTNLLQSYIGSLLATGIGLALMICSGRAWEARATASR